MHTRPCFEHTYFFRRYLYDQELHVLKSVAGTVKVIKINPMIAARSKELRFVYIFIEISVAYTVTYD